MKARPSPLKVGIIRCLQTEDICPGTACFLVTKEGKGAFRDTGPVDIVGFVTCGICPGKQCIPRANMLIEKGAEAIVLSSCMSKGNPIGYPCPHFANIRDAVMTAVGPDIPVIEWTH